MISCVGRSERLRQQALSVHDVRIGNNSIKADGRLANVAGTGAGHQGHQWLSSSHLRRGQSIIHIVLQRLTLNSAKGRSASLSSAHSFPAVTGDIVALITANCSTLNGFSHMANDTPLVSVTMFPQKNSTGTVNLHK